eukprot:3991053-Pyramimonas_sp.AAC.1
MLLCVTLRAQHDDGSAEDPARPPAGCMSLSLLVPSTPLSCARTFLSFPDKLLGRSGNLLGYGDS